MCNYLFMLIYRDFASCIIQRISYNDTSYGFRALELARRRNAADDAETPSSVFLPVDVFVMFPLCASQGERRRRGESTSDSHDLIIFFTLSRKGNRAAGTTAQRREEEASGSTTLLYLSSSPLLSDLLLFYFCVFSSSPFIRFVFTRPDKV